MPDSAAKLQRQLGVTVRSERQARKLTQRQLAFEAELSLTYIGEIERGQRMVSIDTLQRVARAIDLTAAELLAKAGIESPQPPRTFGPYLACVAQRPKAARSTGSNRSACRTKPRSLG